jgi:hypothetical protein
MHPNTKENYLRAKWRLIWRWKNTLKRRNRTIKPDLWSKIVRFSRMMIKLRILFICVNIVYYFD